MSLFSRKVEKGLEEFCYDFYDNQILNPSIGNINVGDLYVESIIKSIGEVSNIFENIEVNILNNEMITLRFELFALAWVHKFISGEIVVSQSVITKNYLQEKGRIDIWDGMLQYSKYIDSATLHWLENLGKRNLVFNYSTRQDLEKENIKCANKLGINIDETIEIVNNRVWSKQAWKDKIIHEALIQALFERINLNPQNLEKEAAFRLAAIIHGFYEGARQSWYKIKFRKL